jgi:DNA-binding transcriptional MerR regulator
MEEDASPQGHSQPDITEATASSGWVTTDVAARAVRVSPRTIRRLIERGVLRAKSEGEGVERRWLVSVDSLHALRSSRTDKTDRPRGVHDDVHESSLADSIADVVRMMSARLEMRTAEAVEMRTRLELTELAQSTIEEEARRLREENQRLREELDAAHKKGFWRWLFGR